MGKPGRKPTGRTTTLVRVPIVFADTVKRFVLQLKTQERKVEPLPSRAIAYLLVLAERNARPEEREKLKEYLRSTWLDQIIKEQRIAGAFEAIKADYGEHLAKFLIPLPQPHDPWWVVLGVEQDACEREVRQAYRHLQRQWHPDVNLSCDRQTATEVSQVINRAYSQFRPR